jgi:hypothetical protein
VANSKPHPANVPGDFYVEENCCTMCGVPFIESPKLFGVVTDDEDYDQCYVKQQPATQQELDEMIKTISAAEFQCIHYSGHDRAVQRRLVQIGSGAACDKLADDLQKRPRFFQ